MTLVGWLVLLVYRLGALFLIRPGGDEVSYFYLTQEIASLRSFPIYFYQQEHMGPLMSYLLAPWFRVFGPSFWSLRLSNLILYVLFAFLFVRTVRRLFEGELARLLLILLALLPFPALFFTTVTMGYEALPFLGLLTLVLLLRAADPRRGLFGISLILGFISVIFLVFQPAHSPSGANGEPSSEFV